MKSKATKTILTAANYRQWIGAIKDRVQRVRLKALMMANAEQNLLYWDVGHEILEKLLVLVVNRRITKDNG